MRVILYNAPVDPLALIVSAARECYDSPSTTVSSDQKLFLNMLKKQESPLEHANFTFKITEVSRTLTHQLVRHRIASFSQQSQRYVKSDGHYFTPTLDYMPKEDKECAISLYDSTMLTIFDRYFELIDLGVKREDARYILPNAAYSSLFLTINLRSLCNLFTLRLATKAQKEIRDLAAILLTLITSTFPLELSDEIINICKP